PVRREAVAGREARADGDVAVAGPNALEQPRELLDGVLTVGVDAATELVVMFQGVAVARRDSGRESAILAERDHLAAVLACDLGRPVGRAVVDDEHVGLREPAPELVQYGRKALFLVPGRQKNERVAPSGHTRRVLATPPPGRLRPDGP